MVTPHISFVWKTRQEVKWERQKLFVVSREGLIALKELGGNGQDLDDIDKLRQQRTD
jgi:hypothetical protein